MPVKHALVVDDSRLARYTLAKMLANYKLAVDTAESAEVALEYLSTNKPPHVIFMDHMMPGMDGLQAVQVIKKDPHTAMIPIIMYTSKEGELYMGQARALGAVGMLPKPIQSVELEKLIHELNLHPEQTGLSPPEVSVKPAAAMPPKTTPSPHPAFTEIAHSAVLTTEQDAVLLFRRLLEDQHGKLKQDLAANSRDIAERVVTLLRQQPPASPGRNFRAARYGLAALFVGFASLVGMTAWYIQRDSQSGAEKVAAPSRATAEEGNAKLVEALTNQLQTKEQNAKLSETVDNLRTQMSDQRRKLIETIEWAVNLNNGYGFDQIALGDVRLPLLNELISRLIAVDFKGTVRIGVYAGDYCLHRDETGEPRVPPDDTPIENCQTLGLSQEQFVAQGARQSLDFAKFLANAPYNNGRINIEVASYGKEKPLYRYPILYSIKTAGEWNKIARLNNRVEVSIVPSAP